MDDQTFRCFHQEYGIRVLDSPQWYAKPSAPGIVWRVAGIYIPLVHTTMSCSFLLLSIR